MKKIFLSLAIVLMSIASVSLFAQNKTIKEVKKELTEVNINNIKTVSPAGDSDITDEIQDVINVANEEIKPIDSVTDFDAAIVFWSMLATLLIGFVSKWIPALNQITDNQSRVAALSIGIAVTVIAMYSFQKGELTIVQAIPSIIGSIFSMGVFYPAIEPLAKTPKVSPRT